MALDEVCGLGNTGQGQGSLGGLKNFFSFLPAVNSGETGPVFPTESPSEKHVYCVCRGEKKNIHFYHLLL